MAAFIAGRTAPPGPAHGPRRRHHQRRPGHGRRARSMRWRRPACAWPRRPARSRSCSWPQGSRPTRSANSPETRTELRICSRRHSAICHQRQTGAEGRCRFSGSSSTATRGSVFFLLGGIFLVVGLGLIIGLGSIPFAGGAMVMTGGIFIVVAIIVIIAGVIAGRSAARTTQVLQTGIPGTATITGLTQTGVYLNENPQIAHESAGPAAGRGALRREHQAGRAADASGPAVERRAAVRPRRPDGSLQDRDRLEQHRLCRLAAGRGGHGQCPADGCGSRSAQAAAAGHARRPGNPGREPQPGPGRDRGHGRHADRQPVLESGAGQLHGRAAARLPAPERSRRRRRTSTRWRTPARSSATSTCSRWR